MAKHLPARTVVNGPQTVENGGVTRDARGRFVAGNPGGGRPANPFARYQAELRGVLLSEVKAADLRAIVRKVVGIAKRGHLPAVELLLKWSLGAPPAAVDPDRLDEDELRVRRGRPTRVDALALADEQADRAPAADDPAEEDGDDLGLSLPPLPALLSWALRDLAEAQRPPALPPPQDPTAGWERFATSRLEWDTDAAVEVDRLYLAYVRWATADGELVLAEKKVLAWLAGKGATVRTSPLSQVVTVVGVRVVA